VKVFRAADAHVMADILAFDQSYSGGVFLATGWVKGFAYPDIIVGAGRDSQFATSKPSRGGRRYRPYAFTEQGVAMLSSVLNSERAIKVNIVIMRAFVRLREILATHKDLARKLKELESKLGEHDERFQLVFQVIRRLTSSRKPRKKRYIGFARD
jgi:hypothetical protein